jgi:hypothetical protein
MRITTTRAIVGTAAALGLGVALAACGTPDSSAADDGAAATTSTAAARPVFVNTEDPAAGIAQRPGTLDLYEHTDLDKISWTTWGGSTAKGTAVLTDDDCTPDCASGHPDTFTANVVLSDVRTVDGKAQYTRYTVTFDGAADHPDLAKAVTDQEIKPV